MANAYHMVHYRRVTKLDGSGLDKDFESYCRAVLDDVDELGSSLWNRVDDRLYRELDGQKQEILLNRVADLKSAVFGEMCMIDSKGLQALLQQNASKVSLSDLTVAEIYQLQESEAPKGTQFIRGMAYWLALGDHLFFVRLGAMSSQSINKYFQWLLVGRKNGVPKEHDFVLQAELDKSQVPGDIGDIRSLRISGTSKRPFVATVVDDEKPQKTTTRKVADRLVEFSRAESLAKIILGEAQTKSLMDSLGPEEFLAVDASVKVRGQRTAASKAKMKELTNEVADIEDGLVQVEGKGGKLSGKDAILRTNMPFELVAENASLLEFDNVADQLQKVYRRFVEDGMIGA